MIVDGKLLNNIRSPDTIIIFCVFLPPPFLGSPRRQSAKALTKTTVVRTTEQRQVRGNKNMASPSCSFPGVAGPVSRLERCMLSAWPAHKAFSPVHVYPGAVPQVSSSV